jgi:hypothetical protein
VAGAVHGHPAELGARAGVVVEEAAGHGGRGVARRDPDQRCRVGRAVAVAALEHDLAVERQPARVEVGAGHPGRAAAQRLADRDLARAERVGQRVRAGDATPGEREARRTEHERAHGRVLAYTAARRNKPALVPIWHAGDRARPGEFRAIRRRKRQRGHHGPRSIPTSSLDRRPGYQRSPPRPPPRPPRPPRRPPPSP